MASFGTNRGEYIDNRGVVGGLGCRSNFGDFTFEGSVCNCKRAHGISQVILEVLALGERIAEEVVDVSTSHVVSSSAEHGLLLLRNGK